MTPNGALGALAGLSEDYNRRHAGKSRIEYEFYDEFVRRAITPEILRQWRDEAVSQGHVFVLMLCGVHTVTYPRGRDIALMARREGITVLAGGIHLSAHGPSVEFLTSCGIHVAIGEVEPIWDVIVADALNERLQPIYRLTPDQGLRVKAATSYITAPDLTDIPLPYIPPAAREYYVNRRQLFVDSSRGCPFLCTFCAVKNVFGRTVRNRDPEKLAAWMAERVSNDGIRAFTFTDDNFSRNPRHLELLEHLARFRATGPKFALWLVLDVESTCYAAEESARGERTRRFMRLCRDAGVAWVYIGLESINDAALQEMRKGVNRDREDVHGDGGDGDLQAAERRLIRRYKAAVDAWHSIGVSVECGAIIGFAADRKGVGKQLVRGLVEVGIDIVHFYQLAPLPGSEDYARSLRDGGLIEPDFNQFLRETPMLAHPTMTPEEVRDELLTAVHELWQWRHVVRRIAKRAFGAQNQRCLSRWDYIKKQLICKITLAAGLSSHVAGGVFRRGAAWSAPREVITDEEARQHFLSGARVELPSATTAEMRDGSSMLSLPVLDRHDLALDKRASAA